MRLSQHFVNGGFILALIIGLALNPAAAAKDNKDKQKKLPPGLQKKLDRGGSLPPGWEKKLVRGEVMEAPVYAQSEVVIPVDSSGQVTVRVEDKLVKVIEATREIIDIVEILNPN